MPSCLLPATSELKGSQHSHPPNKSSRVFVYTREVDTWSIAYLHCSPGFNSSSNPYYNLTQLSTPSPSTPELYNPEAGLYVIKKEPSDPSERPCFTPQRRTVNPKSLVKKIRDSEGKRGVGCVLCGKRLLGGSADGARHVNVHLNGEGWEANSRGIYYSHKKAHGKKLSIMK